VEKVFKQIQECVDYAEAGGITISEAQKLTTAYTKVFPTGNFHSACRCWNERNTQDKTWNNFKIHFGMAYHQHKQLQSETSAASGYANAAVAQPVDDDLAEAAIGAFANLDTVTSVGSGIVANLTAANCRLTNQLEENAQALKEIRALSKKERNNRGARKLFAPFLDK
jgi:hypothetical protein